MPVSETGRQTILVVEDSDAVRRMVCGVLSQCGYDVLEAPDGLAALRLVEQPPGPVHLVLTDVMMPEMGGAELAGRLAQIRPELPVVFMTGYLDDPSFKALHAQPARVISKPFTVGALFNLVKTVLDAK